MKGNGKFTREQHEELGSVLKLYYALSLKIQGHLLEAYPKESVMYKAATCICGGENDRFLRIRNILEDKLKSETPSYGSIEGVYYPEYDLPKEDPYWAKLLIEFEKLCREKPADNLLSVFYNRKGLSKRALGELKTNLIVIQIGLVEWLEDVPLHYQDATLIESIDHTINTFQDLTSILSHEVSLHKVLNVNVMSEVVY